MKNFEIKKEIRKPQYGLSFLDLKKVNHKKNNTNKSIIMGLMFLIPIMSCKKHGRLRGVMPMPRPDIWDKKQLIQLVEESFQYFLSQKYKNKKQIIFDHDVPVIFRWNGKDIKLNADGYNKKLKIVYEWITNEFYFEGKIIPPQGDKNFRDKFCGSLYMNEQYNDSSKIGDKYLLILTRRNSYDIRNQVRRFINYHYRNKDLNKK